MYRNFKALEFQKTKVGKRIKSTKVRFLWKFELDKKEFQIELYLSRISGKRTIKLNGDVYTTEKKSSAAYGNYPVKLGKRIVVVYEAEDNKFDLRVENLSFDAYYNAHKAEPTEFYSLESSSKQSDYPIQTIRSTQNIQNIELEFRNSPTISPRITKNKHAGEKATMKKRLKSPEVANTDMFKESLRENLSLPEDLFSQPLKSSKFESHIHRKNNPFDESSSSKVLHEEKSNKLPDLFDLKELSPTEKSPRSSVPCLAFPNSSYNQNRVSSPTNMNTSPSHFTSNFQGNPYMQGMVGNPNPMMNNSIQNPMMSNVVPNQMMHNAMVNNVMTNPMMPMQGMMVNPMMAYNPFMTGMANPWMGFNK